jgi:hypothetical protein
MAILETNDEYTAQCDLCDWERVVSTREEGKRALGNHVNKKHRDQVRERDRGRTAATEGETPSKVPEDRTPPTLPEPVKEQ